MGVWDWKRIEKEAGAALSKKPDDADASRRLAHAVGMQGQAAQAIQMLQKHVYQHSKDAKAYDMLSAFFIIAGKPAEAIAASDKAVQVDPNFKAAKYNRAVACVKSGKAEEGIRDLSTAIEANAEFREIALEDKDFAPLANNPRFKEATTPPKKT